MSDSLQPHKLQHARLPCHSLYPEVYSNSCPSSRWCHPIIPSFITFFSSCPQSFPTSRYFPMSQFFPTGGQSIGVSALASVLPMNFQGWFPLGLTDLISLQSKRLFISSSSSRVLGLGEVCLGPCVLSQLPADFNSRLSVPRSLFPIPAVFFPPLSSFCPS